MFLVGTATVANDGALVAAVALVGTVLVLVGYPVLFETLTRGKSLGKLVFGLRVVQEDGGPVRFRQSLIRALAGVFVDFWATFGAGAILSSLLNAKGKRVGDILAGTVVVLERVPSRRAAAPDCPACPGGLGTQPGRDPAAGCAGDRGPAVPRSAGRARPGSRGRFGPTHRHRDLSVRQPAGTARPGCAPAYIAAVLAERREQDLRVTPPESPPGLRTPPSERPRTAAPPPAETPRSGGFARPHDGMASVTCQNVTRL